MGPIGVTLGSDNHILVLTQIHAILRPLVEVCTCGNGAANTLLAPHGPVLSESSRPID
jgi:hypothetical protein